MPLISVVIPTRNRPGLVRRAVASCLAQTLDDIEVIVVIDGHDRDTAESLAGLPDPRVRVEMLPSSQGPSVARNRGVALAQGEWIAFLDDDDEWLVSKLSIQYAAATGSRWRFPIVSCRFQTRMDQGCLIWPRRLPAPGERLDEYLFCQRSLFGGEGMVLPSTIFAPAALLHATPFDPAVTRHHDVDWLLRAVQTPGTGIEFPRHSEPLAVWHMESGHNRMSDFPDWNLSLQWASTRSSLMTPRARSAFLLTWASLSGARSRDWGAFHTLLQEAWQTGSPRVLDLAAHFLIWFVPEGFRRRMGILMQKMHRTPP